MVERRDMKLTSEQIDQMQTGSKLDALIAEHVQGLPNHHDEYGSFLPEYSAKIEYAWEVVERMRANGWLFRIADSDEKRDILAAFWKEEMNPRARASTDALAICRAALKAKLMEVKDDR